MPALILGIREASNADDFKHGLENNCSSIPIWVQKTTTLNQLFKTLFTSFGGIVYCVSCARFRKKIKLLLGHTPHVPNNSLAEVEIRVDISQTNEAIPLQIMSNDELQIQVENMAIANGNLGSLGDLQISL